MCCIAAGLDAAVDTVDGLPARTTVVWEEEEGREVWAPDIVPYVFAMGSLLPIWTVRGVTSCLSCAKKKKKTENDL